MVEHPVSFDPTFEIKDGISNYNRFLIEVDAEFNAFSCDKAYLGLC